MSTFASTAPAAKTSGSSAAPARADSGTRRRGLLRWLFVAPALVYMALFFGYPLVRNIVMSFQHYTPTTYFTGEAPFNGLANWRDVFSNELFGRVPVAHRDLHARLAARPVRHRAGPRRLLLHAASR